MNNRWKIAEALDAARYYADATGRRVSIEYALIRDVNDQPWRADLLAKLASKHLGRLVHVNLIPLNPTPGSRWSGTPAAGISRFAGIVRGGTTVTVRELPSSEAYARSWPFGEMRA